MKRLSLLLAVALFVSTTAFAGDIPIGGRTCPNGQTTCLVSVEDRDAEKPADPKAEIPSRWIFVQEIFRYFKLFA